MYISTSFTPLSGGFVFCERALLPNALITFAASPCNLTIACIRVAASALMGAVVASCVVPGSET